MRGIDNVQYIGISYSFDVHDAVVVAVDGYLAFHPSGEGVELD